MATLQEFKCPRCGGSLNFDPTQQQTKCPFCDTTFEMSALLAYDQGLESIEPDVLITEEGAGEGEWTNAETENMYVYVCKSCGGEIVGDPTLAATKCPYCDNPVVVKEKFAGDLKPDYIIPFRFNKEAAKKALQDHMKGKKLLPKVFSDQNHLDEVKGVYVPVWLYDADAFGNATYRGETVDRWEDRDFEYMRTNYYALQRAGNMSFQNVPVDASKKMDDIMMQSLEPFDMSQAVPFQSAYLAGFMADRYDEDAQTRIATANSRIKRTMESALSNTTAGYMTVSDQKTSVRLENVTAKYALYPVWLLSTHWNNQNYLFAMNGQTGKFVGDLPMDKAASTRIFLRTAVGVALAALAIGFAVMFL